MLSLIIQATIVLGLYFLYTKSQSRASPENPEKKPDPKKYSDAAVNTDGACVTKADINHLIYSRSEAGLQKLVDRINGRATALGLTYQFNPVSTDATPLAQEMQLFLARPPPHMVSGPSTFAQTLRDPFVEQDDFIAFEDVTPSSSILETRVRSHPDSHSSCPSHSNFEAHSLETKNQTEVEFCWLNGTLHARIKGTEVYHCGGRKKDAIKYLTAKYFSVE